MRYVVDKKSGSVWAIVVDTHTGLTVKRFHILKGVGKNNGWCRADRYKDEMNAAEKVKDK